MNKKFLLVWAVVLVLTGLLAINVFAEEPVTTVYVMSGGTGDGLSESSPTGSINTAMKLLTADGTVVILNEFPISSSARLLEIPYSYTLTAKGAGCLSLSAEFGLAAGSVDNTVTFDLPVKVNGTADIPFYGSFNNVVFGQNFSVTSVDGASLNFYGGQTTVAETTEGICTSPYSITVHAGTFGSFNGGNYRPAIESGIGSIAAPISVTIHGGTFGKTGTYDLRSNNKNYDAFSVSGMSLLADDATLNIYGGTFHCPIFIQGRIDTIRADAVERATTVASDRKYYALDGDINVNITGGTFNGGGICAYYTQAAYTSLMRGNFDISITGGTFKAGTVVDATQVKAYPGSDKKATIAYTDSNITPVRFDTVNGVAKTYDEPLRAVFIGDSITEGYAPTSAGVDRLTQSYPAQFLALCEDSGKEVIISNFGISSSGLHPSLNRYYLETLAYRMVTEEADPDYVFFAIGTNDASTIGGTTGARKIYEKNLTEFAAKMGSLPDTEKVFISNAIYRNSSSGVTNHRASAVLRPTQERIAKTLAEQEPGKYIFVDLYGLTLPAAKAQTLFTTPTTATGDNLHPTQNGLKLMAQSFYDAAFKGVTAPAPYRKTDIYVSASGTPFGTGTKDDPISDLGYAFDIMERDVPVTLHIVGAVSTTYNLYTSVAPSTLTVVGEGTDAVLSTSANTLKIGSTVIIDNLTIQADGTALGIYGSFNNVKLTETVKTSGQIQFYAGHNVFQDVDPSTVGTHDTAEDVSSDEDLVIQVLGGTYSNFMLGNRRCHGSAPFGTYSGNMLAVIGQNVAFGSDYTYRGINGHNYVAESVTAMVQSWPTADINAFPEMGSGGENYNTALNTGVTHIFSDGICQTCGIDHAIGIYTGLQLSEIMQGMGTSFDYDTDFILMNDVDLTGLTQNPIGNQANPYTGSFDGNGKTVSGLSISGSTPAIGLFGRAGNGAVIEDLTVNGEVTNTGNCTGGIVGWGLNDLIIRNCTFNGKVNGVSRAAGIMGGYNTNSATEAVTLIVENCTNNGEIIATGHSCGGVVGGMVYYSSVETTAKILGCTNTGDVHTDSSVGGYGGILGRVFGYVNPSRLDILNCTNSGDICVNGTDASGKDTAFNNVNLAGTGGIVGRLDTGTTYGSDTAIDPNAYWTVADCTNTGNVVDKTSNGYAGGITGLVTAQAHVVSISGSENSGAVTATNGAAGISGFLRGYKFNSSTVDSPVTLTACTNDGPVVGAKAFGIANAVTGSTVTTPVVTDSVYTGTVNGVACSHNWVDSVCDICGVACGHDYTAQVTDPTCTAEGLAVYTCTDCGHSYSETIPAAGHSYEARVTAPTCTEGGYTTFTCVCGDTYIGDETPAAGHSYVEGICQVCGAADPYYTKVKVTAKYPGLAFMDEIYYNVYFAIDNPEGEQIVEMGLITWTSPVDGDITNAEYVCPGAVLEGSYWKTRSQAISAKNMGEELYFKAYAKLESGVYVYSVMRNYSARSYCESKLATSNDAALKALCVALMNYGAAAQEYFSYKTDDLMNASLTAEQQALAAPYSDDMIPELMSIGTKGDSLKNNGGYSQRYPHVTFGGALAINYNFTPAYTPGKGMKLYVWTQADAAAAEVLALENASQVVDMTNNNGVYVGSITGIAAKNAGDTYFVCGVYESGGVTYYTGVLSYSISAYCKGYANSFHAFQPLASTAAVYTYYADAYLNG